MRAGDRRDFDGQPVPFDLLGRRDRFPGGVGGRRRRDRGGGPAVFDHFGSAFRACPEFRPGGQRQFVGGGERRFGTADVGDQVDPGGGRGDGEVGVGGDVGVEGVLAFDVGGRLVARCTFDGDPDFRAREGHAFPQLRRHFDFDQGIDGFEGFAGSFGFLEGEVDRFLFAFLVFGPQGDRGFDQHAAFGREFGLSFLAPAAGHRFQRGAGDHGSVVGEESPGFEVAVDPCRFFELRGEHAFGEFERFFATEVTVREFFGDFGIRFRRFGGLADACRFECGPRLLGGGAEHFGGSARFFAPRPGGVGTEADRDPHGHRQHCEGDQRGQQTGAATGASVDGQAPSSSTHYLLRHRRSPRWSVVACSVRPCGVPGDDRSGRRGQCRTGLKTATPQFGVK
ncbi:MAG TPA: hypothetical protein VHZ54_14530 [Solirubrobacterales bacterium]|nr:hypothetical protein [Solirubrobacterales bacterium]